MQTPDNPAEIARCWPGTDDLMNAYHDEEWGVPKHDDTRLLESLILDGAQAGLSWTTILNKREAYREAFEGFDPATVAAYDEAKYEELLNNAGIVRNRQKIRSAINNAKRCLEVQQEFGSLDAYLWSFVDGSPIVNSWQTLAEVPATSPESEAMSKDLRSRGFTFVGPTICYAFMQAEGMVMDHVITCFRHRELGGTCG